jgi:hypothetical protein
VITNIDSDSNLIDDDDDSDDDDDDDDDDDILSLIVMVVVVLSWFSERFSFFCLEGLDFFLGSMHSKLSE